MKTPQDWDAEERDALAGFERELAELRRRHQGHPSLAMLRAAAANALPPELQARVDEHLKESAWSRTLVEGLHEAAGEDRLDASEENRLLARIMNEARVAAIRPASPRWQPAVIAGGLALAATVILAVMWPRPAEQPAPPVAAAPAAPGTPAQPVALIAFAKPDVKLSASALTWRAGAANPFMTDIAPAFEAYRSDDYPKAATMFEQLLVKYPNSIELLFYRGVSLMLAGNDAGAIAPLEAAAKVADTTFADDVAWFLAVARQHAGNKDANTFEQLCRGRSSYADASCAAAKQLGASATSSPQP